MQRSPAAVKASTESAISKILREISAGNAEAGTPGFPDVPASSSAINSATPCAAGSLCYLMVCAWQVLSSL